MSRPPTSAARARSPAPRERRSIEERREQLLMAGHELFCERPYDQVSMDDVAQHAGVSKALVFHYFSTKRDLYVEIVKRAAAELLDATLVPPELPPLERLALGLSRYLDFVEKNERGYVALLTSGVGVDSEVYGVIESVRRALAERMLEGLPSPRSPAHEVVVRGAIGFVEHASHAWIERRAISRDELVALCARVLVAALELPSLAGSQVRSWDRLALTALTLVSAGCFGLPPSEWSATIAAERTQREQMVPMAQVRGVIKPLGVVDSLRDRRFDVGVGFHADLGEHSLQYGPSASAGAFPYLEGGEGTRARLYVGGEVRALRDQGSKVWGPVLATQVAFEVTGYGPDCDTSTSGGFTAACWYGENGIGVFADGGVGTMDGRVIASVGVGVTFRSPAVFGIYIPIPK